MRRRCRCWCGLSILLTSNKRTCVLILVHYRYVVECIYLSVWQFIKVVYSLITDLARKRKQAGEAVDAAAAAAVPSCTRVCLLLLLLVLVLFVRL